MELKYAAVLLSILLIGTFTIVVWNMYLPIPSARNIEFLDYLEFTARTTYENNEFLQNNVDRQLVQPVAAQLDAIGIIDQDTPALLNVGQRVMYEDDTQHAVTLTFYVQYGNQQNILALLDTLYEYDLDKAVFFIEQRYLNDHEFVGRRIADQGYVIKIWEDLSGYGSPGYYPTIYRGIPLVENEVLSKVEKDRDAIEFFRVALRYYDSSVVAFSPKIMAHKMILEDILKQKGKGIVFSDQPVAAEQQPVHEPQEYGVSSNVTPLRVESGSWTMSSLSERYPSVVRYFEGKSAYIVSRPVVIGSAATITISGDHVLLESPLKEDHVPAYLEIRGKGIIVNSTVTSWDPITMRPAIDPYVPRPYIIVIYGQLDVIGSTIKHLGYSLGGLSDTRYAHAALEYHGARNFVIANSTIAYNYYGFYSEESSNFRIVDNKVYGQSRYGLDPHTWSVDFIIDSNHVHDNGNQGIICSLYCANVTITNNIVEYNVEGIGLHWLTNSSRVENNIVQYNEKYGIFVQKQSYNNTIQNNIVVGNRYGVGLLEGSTGNTVVNNIIVDNAIDRFLIDQDSTENTIQDNKFHYDEVEGSQVTS
ncbi:MAG TPA: right-handed parallel beta-helix repeat-containing protein [Nitrososphaera sp.]|nr:right-handed parallel beta-helix repeat-containing protein [Nitrososphaera sp.]